MMYLPDLPYASSPKKSFQAGFGGYNHTLGAGDGEIYDMLNLTSNHFPVLSSRDLRYIKASINADNGIIYVDGEQYRVHGTELYHKDRRIGTMTDSEKKFAVLPYYLVIYPDKKVVRLKVKGYCNDLDDLTAITEKEVNDIYGVGETAPYASYYWDGEDWVKSGNIVEDMETSWSAGEATFLAEGEYAGVPADNNTIYVEDADWPAYFKVGDAVEISGCTKHEENNKSVVIKEIEDGYLRFYENAFSLDYQWIYQIKHHKEDDHDKFCIGKINDDSDMIWQEYCFNADGKRIVFSIHSALTEPPGADADSVSVVYEPDGFVAGSSGYLFDTNAIIFKEGLLYHRWVNGNLTALKNFTVWEKIAMNQTNDNDVTAWKSDDVKISAKKYYFAVDGESYYCTLTDLQYNTYQDQTGYFMFASGGLKFYPNAGSSVDLSFDSSVTWDETLYFAASAIDHFETSVTLKRTVPDMDYILGHHNRIWGCKGDKIYASKLGDPFNFNVFEGLSTDSYVVESGTPGEFTAAFTYLGYPLFFKENSIIKMYGDRPGDFQAYNTATNGVAAGSHKSLAVAGETLYYHNKNGIMAYTGGIPSLASPVFGNALYLNGIGGSDGNKYYVDLKDFSDDHHLFVYDPLRNLWMKEDTEGISCFVNFDGELWAYGGDLITMSARLAPSGTSPENSMEWMMETADITGGSSDKKGISGFQLRCEVTGGMTVSLQCDGGEWVEKYECNTTEKKTLLIPIIPQRADHYRLKMEGTGEVKLFGLAIQYYDGSEL